MNLENMKQEMQSIKSNYDLKKQKFDNEKESLKNKQDILDNMEKELKDKEIELRNRDNNCVCSYVKIQKEIKTHLDKHLDEAKVTECVKGKINQVLSETKNMIQRSLQQDTQKKIPLILRDKYFKVKDFFQNPKAE